MLSERLTEVAEGFEGAGGGEGEVLVELDGVGWEEEDEARSSKGEVPFGRPFFLKGFGSEGLVDGADVGGADFNGENCAEVDCVKSGDHPFVFGEDGGVFFEGDGVDGIEGARDESGSVGDAVAGEVESVVIDGGKTGDDHGPLSIFLCEGGVL